MSEKRFALRVATRLGAAKQSLMARSGGDLPPLFGTGNAWRAVALLLLLALCTYAASPQSAKPRVPPGRHPGGWPVAFIGPGVDYTNPLLAQRLTRDGEGEIVGWDFVDNDRRPWQACVELGCATLVAQTVLGEHGASTLVVIRASADRPQTLVEAVKLAARGPARVVLLAPDGGSLPTGFLAEAASRHPQLLLIVPAAQMTASGPIIEQTPPHPNVIVVAAVTAATIGQAAPGVDVAVPVLLHSPAAGPAAGPAVGPAYKASTEVAAAARVAALASRLQAVKPDLDAAAMKRTIIGLATPPPAGPSNAVRPRHGWIERPDRPFRLE